MKPISFFILCSVLLALPNLGHSAARTPASAAIAQTSLPAAKAPKRPAKFKKHLKRWKERDNIFDFWSMDLTVLGIVLFLAGFTLIGIGLFALASGPFASILILVGGISLALGAWFFLLEIIES